MDTQDPSQPASSTEQQQQFFQNLGQLASRFLEPLGLHVSVDSIQKEEKKESASAKVGIMHQCLLNVAEIVRLTALINLICNLHTPYIVLMFISAIAFFIIFMVIASTPV